MSALHPLLHDMVDAMQRADDPIPYVIDPIAVRGAVTVVVGRHSSKKSWLMIAACAAANNGGGRVGAVFAEPAPALYIDAEMGARQMAKRWRDLGLDDRAFLVADGFKLRLPTDQVKIADLIESTGSQLVVLDSLRRLAPGIREDKSDDISPVMAALAELSRDLDVAPVLIHHRSTKPNAPDVRGSSAIEDQADIVFAFEHMDGDPDEDRRRLRPVKFRVDVPPPEKWFRLCEIDDVFTINRTVAFESGDKVRPPAAHVLKADEAERLVPEINSLAGWPVSRLYERLGLKLGGTWTRTAQELRLRDWRFTGSGSSRRIHPPPDSTNQT